jgi:hypothetical protein
MIEKFCRGKQEDQTLQGDGAYCEEVTGNSEQSRHDLGFCRIT